MTSSSCLLCGNKQTRPFIDLGTIPLAHRLLPLDAAEDQRHPLQLRVCGYCLLVQRDGPEPHGDPAPVSKDTRPNSYAAAMIDRFGLGPRSLVMEVASTDGTRLGPFREAGIPILGIEPAPALVALARARDIPTEATHLNAETAMDIAAHHGRADLVIARDVMAEVPDLFGFAAGFAGILRPNGVAAIEFPHLLWLMEQIRFGTISHTQCSNLSLLVVERVLRSVGLMVFDLERLPACGILRVFVGHARGPYSRRPSVKTMQMREMAAGLARPEAYDSFAPRVAETVRSLRQFIESRRQSDRRIAGYGATPEAATLLNCCGLGTREVLCVGDPVPARQGLKLPGSHVPVVALDTLALLRPDDVLVFPGEGSLAELASILPRETSFWGMGVSPRALIPHSEAAPRGRAQRPRSAAQTCSTSASVSSG